jgi:phage FluMu gp28-like protein
MKQSSFFLPYQARWILDDSRLKLLEKSRQIGMSLATAYKLVRTHSSANRRMDSWVSSRDELQARLFLNDCKLFASIFSAIGKHFKSKILPEQGRQSSMALHFANGSAIQSLSANPDAQAGKRGNRILDEFAIHGDPKTLYSIAIPGITWGGQLEILSTHRGSLNFFNELVNEARFNKNAKGFSLHRVTLQDALEQGFLQKLKCKLPSDDKRQHMDEAEYFDFIRSGCPDEETFQQEYMCRPMDDKSAFLPYELILSCEYAAAEQWQTAVPPSSEQKNLPKNQCYLGVDLGRDHDLTVFWLLEYVDGKYLTRRAECLKGCPFAEQERFLRNFFEISNLRNVCIDRTGIGCQFAERAVERFGKFRVEGITLTSATKESLAYSLRKTFEDRTIRIPPSDEIRADLHSVRREISHFGNLRFCADRRSGGHGDRFWALALAIHASRIHQCGRTCYDGSFCVLERPRRSLLL